MEIHEFKKGIFDVIEIFSYELREQLDVFHSKKISVAISDCHGDILLYLLPFFITKSISKFVYDGRDGYLAFNRVRNSSTCINCGDLFPTDPSITNSNSIVRNKPSSI